MGLENPLAQGLPRKRDNMRSVTRNEKLQEIQWTIASVRAGDMDIGRQRAIDHIDWLLAELKRLEEIVRKGAQFDIL